MFKNVIMRDSIPSKKDLINDNIELKKFNDWELIATSTVVKKQFKDSISKFEIVQSYFHAAEVLSKNMNDPINSGEPIIKVLTLRSLGVPFMYLCRQTAELSIKLALEITNIKMNGPTHNIKKLWNTFVNKNASIIYESDKMFIERIGVFIDFLDSIDCDGSHLRYATSNQDELYREKPYFINHKKIITELSSMLVTLNSIDMELLKK